MAVGADVRQHLIMLLVRFSRAQKPLYHLGKTVLQEYFADAEQF